MTRPSPHRRVLLAVLPALVALTAPALAAPAPAVPARGEQTIVFPNAVFTGSTEALEITTRSALPGGSVDVVLTPTLRPAGATPGRAYTGALTPQGVDGTRWTTALRLATPTGTPAAPGAYDVDVRHDGVLVQHCSACFTVLTKGAPGVRQALDLAPRRLERGQSREVEMLGSSFTDGTVVESVAAKGIDPSVVLTGATALVQGPDLGTRITRRLTVAPDAPLGYRSLRFTNRDGRTTTCSRCFTVTAPAEAVEPSGSTDDAEDQTVVLRVPSVVPAGARLRLSWVGEGAPRPALDLVSRGARPPVYLPSATAPQTTVLTGSFDLTEATPGLHAYAAGYVLADGSTHDCEGVCRFTVRDVGPPAPTPPPRSPLDADPEHAPGTPSLRLDRTAITVQQSVLVSGRAEPSATLDLFARTRPSVTWRLVRSTVVPRDGRWSFTLAPTGNTRLYARARNLAGERSGDPVTLTVSPSVTLRAARTGRLTYRLTGTVTPAPAGGTVTVGHVVGGALVTGELGPEVVGGRSVGLLRVRTRPDGTFSAERRFAHGGPLRLYAATPATSDRASGRSPLLRLSAG